MKPDARVKQSDFRAGLITDTKEVSTMIEKFRDKCGATNLKEVLFEIRGGDCGQIELIQKL
jgi:hypothetical protein